MYEGSWFNNKKFGYGILSKISKDGSRRKCYAGNWVAGKKHGYGSNWYQDESYYEGTFFQDKRHGSGRNWYVNGDYYQGTWKDDYYDGRGMLVRANGNRYEGEFTKGKKEGCGVYYHLKTGQIQRGIWKNDICVHGIIEDSHWRQTAFQASSYPIPEIS